MAAATLAAACALSARASTVSGCASAGYSYGGAETSAPARGMAATLTPLRGLHVTSGHVAAWVGVGGAGKGAGGVDEWLQIGIASLPGGTSELYYEVTLPGRTPKYATVRRVTSRASHRVAVVESAPDVWQAWLDGRRISPPFRLPSSDGRWRPQVATESYDGGVTACNGYAFRLGRIVVSGGTGQLERFATDGHTVRPVSADCLLVSRR